MKYPFWINDFDRIKNYKEKYPLASKIFEYPQAFWYGDNPKKPKKWMEKSIQRLLKRAEPQLPVFVMYNIPNRDVGQYSKGGAKTKELYLEFIENFAEGIGDNSPIIIYEPDALPHSTLLSEKEQEWRLALMKESLEILTTKTNGIVYIDIGHPAWLSPEQVNELLDKVSNDKVRGFSINSCNYRSTKECLKFGRKITKLRPNEYFVIDTSRNGNGSLDKEWCNPLGRAIGEPPTTDTEYKKCDAYLWIKIPGESDGKCNGGPKAGKFWGEQAEELVRNSKL
jgi:endoglucanase